MNLSRVPVFERLGWMSRSTAPVASGLAFACLACGAATASPQDDPTRSSHAAAGDSLDAAPMSGTEGSSTETAVGQESEGPSAGDVPVRTDDLPAVVEPSAELAPASCLGEPGCPWSVRANMPDAMRGQGTVALDGRIYVVGGESVQDNRRSSPEVWPAPTSWSPALYSTVYVYDPVSDSWSDRARLPLGLYVLTAHALGGQVVVFGGYGQQGFDANVQVYDPASDTWQLQAPMPTPRYIFTSEVVDGKVYVVGGHGPVPGEQTTDWRYMSDVEIFDPVQGWSIGSASPEPLAGAASCAIAGRVFVFGGMLSNLTSIYDVATDEWITGTPPALARAGHACVRVGGKFYLLGGYSGDVMTDRVETYDPAADAWETLPALPTSRYWLGAAAIGDGIFTFGGARMVTTADADDGLSAAVEVLRVSPP